MRVRKRPPTHPGAVLLAHHIEPLDLSLSATAEMLHVSRKTLSKIVNERGAITADMALRLSRAFGTTPDLWLNLQRDFDLWHAERKRDWRTVQPIVANVA